jgi:hypothetical protein
MRGGKTGGKGRAKGGQCDERKAEIGERPRTPAKRAGPGWKRLEAVGSPFPAGHSLAGPCYPGRSGGGKGRERGRSPFKPLVFSTLQTFRAVPASLPGAFGACRGKGRSGTATEPALRNPGHASPPAKRMASRKFIETVPMGWASHAKTKKNPPQSQQHTQPPPQKPLDEHRILKPEGPSMQEGDSHPTQTGESRDSLALPQEP